MLGKLLFGSDYPFTNARATIAALRGMNLITEGTNLPKLPMGKVEELIHRDTLNLLGITG